MLNSDDLLLVLSLAKNGRMNRAADALGRHHSTIFRQLRELEQRLGYPLFLKLDGRYQPTEAGEEIARLAERITEDLSGLERRLSGQELTPKGMVRLTTTDTLFHGMLCSHLPAFRECYPEIQLEILIENRFATLTRREADIALRPSNNPPENLVGRRLGQIETAVYGAEDYLKRPHWITDQDMDWIGFEDSLAHLASAQWLDKYLAGKEPVIRINSLHAAAEACRAGLGLALLPEFLAADGLVQWQKPDPDWRTELWLLTHPDLRQVPRIRAVMDYLGKVLSNS